MNLTPPPEQGPAPDAADDRSPAPAAKTGKPAPATEKPPLLLIAEDDLPFRKWLSEALLDLGFRVTLAADGVQAVTAALQVQPDVILMDLNLPAMDGLQATAAIRKDPRTRHIPVIALSAYSGNARERARAVGCNAFVAKPVTAEHVAIQTRLVMAERRLKEKEAELRRLESGEKRRETGEDRRHDSGVTRLEELRRKRSEFI